MILRISAILLVLTCAAARGGDHFLTIGGGDSPSNNQVSLEKNVLFFQHLLDDRIGRDALHDVFFSDGTAGSRDVQYAATNIPKVNQLLGELFNPDEDIAHRYRPHRVPNLRGPATREAIEQWFNQTGTSLHAGDRLFIYFTGHGGAARRGHNTEFTLWNQRPMTVSDMSRLLDRLDPEVRVVLIMVQCHAGGFADLIFEGGRSDSSLSAARRCGFFATTFDRAAAGCTPDISEEDYRDYSTYFFAALAGKTRTGRAVAPPDYDGDGKVSLAEAHAYATAVSETIDIPIATSDVFLRRFSRMGRGMPLAPGSPFEQLTAAASPAQRAVLDGLSDALKLSGSGRAEMASSLAQKIIADRKGLEKERTTAAERRDRAARGIRQRLARRWPELTNPWRPGVPELLRTEGEAIQKAIESDRSFSRFDQARKQVDNIDDQDLALDRRWARCQRFLRTAENIALAANLATVADEATVARYHTLLSDEAASIPEAPRRDAKLRSADNALLIH